MAARKPEQMTAMDTALQGLHATAPKKQESAKGDESATAQCLPHKLPPVPDIDGQRWCRACQGILPVSAFPTGKRRYLCRHHLWERCTKAHKVRKLSDMNNRHVYRLWRRCWEDAKVSFGQKKITLVQKHIAEMLKNVHDGNQNVKFATNMLKTVHDGNHVKFAANLDRSCDYVLQNFSDCAAIVPVDPDKVLSPANAAVVDMPGRSVLLQACKVGGNKAYVRALARIVE